MNTTNLQFLVSNSNLSQRQLCSALGIDPLSMVHYLNGTSTPRLDTIIHIADYFAVPLDYICGRCTKEECDAIEGSFADNFRILRREEYEKSALKFHPLPKMPEGYHGAYPYNLLDDILKEPFNHVLSEDEENGLKQALSSLSEREQACIALYYGKEMTLKEVGKEFNVGQERVRQIIAKAIRKLRHPSRLNQIRYGEKENQRRIDLNLKEEELNRREKILEYNEHVLENRSAEVEKLLEIREIIKREKEQNLEYDAVRPQFRCSEAFMTLDWSVRAFNCLMRANINTVQKTLDAIRTPDKHWIHDSSVIRVRNLGRQTYKEVLDRIEKATGEDLSAYRHGYDIFDDNGNLIA